MITLVAWAGRHPVVVISGALAVLLIWPLLARYVEARLTSRTTPAAHEVDAWTRYHAACEVAYASRIGGETEEIVAACADRMLWERRRRVP